MGKTLVPLHRPPVQQSTGWRLECHHSHCVYAADGFMTKRGARRALVHHLTTEHPTEEP
jgi:hypothetical protein